VTLYAYGQVASSKNDYSIYSRTRL